MDIVVLTEAGCRRVCDAKKGMVFPVHIWSHRISDDKRIAHVRDYRYLGWRNEPFCIWSLAPEDYELIKE